jgi:hypothetical protein
VIRFTWMQARAQTMVAIGALAVTAVVLLITGPHLVHLYDTSVATCGAHGDCPAVTSAFLREDSTLRTWLDVVVIVMPGVIGIFWGAPLVARELEAGTFRLAWSQSVTRTRWLATKLAVIGLASMAVAGLLSLMVTWWASPLDRVHMNTFGTFDQRDIVPIGYAAFAFALGVTAGVFIRRTVPAMAATLVAFVAARIAVIHWIRPHLITPAHQELAVRAASIVGYGPSGLFGGGPSTLQLTPPDIPGAWIYSTQLADRAGHPITAQFEQSACPALAAGPSAGGPAGGIGSGGSHSHAPAAAQRALADCAATVAARFHEMVTYQPASRYWAFQWYELAIFLGAALLLAGACFWRVRRRRCEELHIRLSGVSQRTPALGKSG